MAVVVPTAIAVLVCLSGLKGFDLWSKARAEAGGAPHCVLAHAGNERSRQARSGWDLSPLVNRRWGIWAPSKGPVLVVRDGEAVRAYRRINGKWSSVEEGRTVRCRPR